MSGDGLTAQTVAMSVAIPLGDRRRIEWWKAQAVTTYAVWLELQGRRRVGRLHTTLKHGRPCTITVWAETRRTNVEK